DGRGRGRDLEHVRVAHDRSERYQIHRIDLVPHGKEQHPHDRREPGQPAVTDRAVPSRSAANPARDEADDAICWAVRDTCRLESVSCSIVSTTWAVAERCCWVVNRTCSVASATRSRRESPWRICWPPSAMARP